ncbi:MAG: L-lactate dehydrogenase [Clostridiales bacterium]|nr:L-lactate dehydrogenase [Clostridiales bacterium]
MKTRGKIVIIGAGFVGASAAFSIASEGIASELVLVDVRREKAEGEAMDINHGLLYLSQMQIRAGDYSDIKGADIVVITAGTARKPGETRLDLTKRNASIIKDMLPSIMEHYDGAVLLVVSNPVDVNTYLVKKYSGLPAEKVIGSGTVLDTARFRYLLSAHCNVDVRNVHGYILGEHGDSQFAAWSLTNLAGERLDEFCSACKNFCGGIERDKILTEVKECGAKIIQYKGATYYGIAVAVTRICEAIIKDQNSILTVGSVINGHYGLEDVTVNLPCVVGLTGIQRVLDISLSEDEMEALKNSAAKIKEAIEEVI